MFGGFLHVIHCCTEQLVRTSAVSFLHEKCSNMLLAVSHCQHRNVSPSCSPLLRRRTGICKISVHVGKSVVQHSGYFNPWAHISPIHSNKIKDYTKRSEIRKFDFIDNDYYLQETLTPSTVGESALCTFSTVCFVGVPAHCHSFEWQSMCCNLLTK